MKTFKIVENNKTKVFIDLVKTSEGKVTFCELTWEYWNYDGGGVSLDEESATLTKEKARELVNFLKEAYNL